MLAYRPGAPWVWTECVGEYKGIVNMDRASKWPNRTAHPFDVFFQGWMSSAQQQVAEYEEHAEVGVCRVSFFYLLCCACHALLHAFCIVHPALLALHALPIALPHPAPDTLHHAHC